MSWSISVIGTPENVCKALDEESGKLTGQSKVEFDDALPHLKAIVAQNFASAPYVCPLIDLEASGHGSAQADPVNKVDVRQVQRQLSVTLRHHYKKIV